MPLACCPSYTAAALLRAHFRGLVGTIGMIAREEGASALWKGLEPGEQDRLWTVEHPPSLSNSGGLGSKSATLLQGCTDSASLVDYALACMSR